MNRFKRVSPSKLSARKRGVFVDKKPLKADVCPICGEPLKEMEYVGKKALASLSSGGFVGDLKEGGKEVWREVDARGCEDKKPFGSGLEASKAGFCVFTNDVECLFRAGAKRSTVMDRCFECAVYVGLEREMDEEDEKMMNELDEIHRRFPV